MTTKALIHSIAYYLPEKVENNDATSRLTKKIGIYHRHIAGSDECASDLAVHAAQKLWEKNINKNEIDFLILCTQSPDYILPTTACILQNKLGLSKHCGAMDFQLGCSGYIYGLSIAKGLIETGQAKNILLLTAETYSKYIHPLDQAVRPLFGDAATATLVIAKEAPKTGIKGLVFGTDGSGYRSLIVPMGASRIPHNQTLIEEKKDDFGNIHTNENLHMDGAKISSFALEIVPEILEKILQKCNLNKNHIDYYVFHQANKFMLDFLQAKCELNNFPYWNDVSSYGNTVSNSIPIALVDMMKRKEYKKLRQVMLIGFGVGLSWGGCIVDLDDCIKNNGGI